MAVLPKRGLIAAYSTVQEAIVLWSTDGWRQLATIDVGPASGFTVSPDESTIVVAGLSDEQSAAAAGFSRSRLVVVDVRSRNVTHEVSTRGTRRVAFAPDGDQLATLETGGLLRLRSADGREEVRRAIDVEDDEPTELAWRPDSRVIAVALSRGGTVLVDPVSGRVSERLPPPRQADPVSLSWSPDGQFLAGSNRALDDDDRPSATAPSLWTVGADRLAQRMCEIAGSGPSTDEWKRWIGGSIAPRRLCVPPRSPGRRSGAGAGVRAPVVAYQRGAGLYVAGADGRGKMVANVGADAGAPVVFDWSPRGSLVWVSEDEVHLLEPGQARPTDWVCPCASAMFDGETVVAVDRDASALLRFEPGRDKPTHVAIRGLPPFEPRVIATAAGSAVVAAFEHEPDRATPSQLYRVDRGGAVRELGRAVGAIYDRGFADRAGQRVAFVSVQSGGACYSPSHVEVLDLETGRLTRPKMPLGRETQVVRSMSWTRGGVLQTAIAPLGCDDNSGPGTHPPGELYSLRDGDLVASGRRAYDIQPGAAATAVIEGPVPTTTSVGTLVLDRRGRPRMRVAGGVRYFLVRP